MLNLGEKGGVDGSKNKFDNHSTSKSEIKQQRDGRERSESDALNISERQQTMTGGKVKDGDRLVDSVQRQHQNPRETFDLDNQYHLD